MARSTAKDALAAIPTVEVGSISDLIQDAENANLGTQRGTYMIQESITTLGAGRSVVADKSNRLIGGNKTAEGFAAAGLEKVIFIETDGDALIVHRRKDLDLTDPEGKARQLAIADNRAAELNLNWDFALLAQQVNEGADFDAYWFPEEFDRALDAVVRESEALARNGSPAAPHSPAASPETASVVGSAGADDSIPANEPSGENAPAQAIETPTAETGAERVSNYREQYGVIVICKDEAEQAAIYERLHGEGLTCRVVVT